jgi:Pentapeptide repeats (9 copies)
MDIGEDDQVPVPWWLTCTHRNRETGRPCIGMQVAGFDRCLEHLEPVQLTQALQRLGTGVDLEAPGTVLTGELFERILGAVAAQDGSRTFGRVFLAQAHFTGRVSLTDVRFCGDANFAGARFSQGARLDGAQFRGDALFIDARFGRAGYANFSGAQFCKGAWFEVARFTGYVSFNHAQFRQNASFAEAQFGGGAGFDGAQFSGDARFDGAQFSGGAGFDGAQFGGDAGFDGAQFGGDARFMGARFEKAASLGPLAASSLVLQQSVFMRPVLIEAAAVRVACNDVKWEEGVTLRLRYAQVDLRCATFTSSSFIVGARQPFEPTPGLRYLDEGDVLIGISRERRESAAPWMPVVLSLRGADVFNVSVTDVDLSQYRRGVRLVMHLCWLGLKATGRALLELLKKIGELLGEFVEEQLEDLVTPGALWTGAKLLLAFLKALPVIAFLLAWLLAAHRWAYVVPITVVVTAVVVVIVRARRQIADKWSLPKKLVYRADSDKREAPLAHTPKACEAGYAGGTGWYASHDHTEVGPYTTRRAAAHALVTLRQRLRKTDMVFRYASASHPSSDLDSHWWDVQRRMQAWASFPANRDPRPLVLFDPIVLTYALPPGEPRSAFERGLIEAVPGFPAEILHILRHHGRTEARDRQASEKVPAPIQPLLATRALPCTAQFLTDRGRQALPAWKVYAQGIKQPMLVLDPQTIQRIWQPSQLSEGEWCWHGSVAELTAVVDTGHTTTVKDTIALRFSVTADEHTVYPRVEVHETATSVAVIPIPVESGPPNSRGSSKRRSEQRLELSAALDQPLGRRILLDGNGYPVLVPNPCFPPPVRNPPGDAIDSTRLTPTTVIDDAAR